ncbi:MAG: hypothetical protein WBA28_03580, partial [Microbacteriaceae bacterium]
SGHTADAAASSQDLAMQLQTLATDLGQMAGTACTVDPASQSCADLSAQANKAALAAQKSGEVATSAGTANGYAQALNHPTTGLPGLAGGIHQLATQAAPLAQNSAALATGADQLAGGASSLATGLGSLKTGSEELATGSEELSTGLGEATEQLPSYSEEDAKNVSEVISNPITVNTTDTSLQDMGWLGSLGAVLAWVAIAALLIAVWLSVRVLRRVRQ